MEFFGGFIFFTNDAITIYAHTYSKIIPLPMKYLYILYQIPRVINLL